MLVKFPVSALKRVVLHRLQKVDPERYERLLASTGMAPGELSLCDLFGPSGLQDLGGSLQMANYLASCRYVDSVKDWLDSGGSPLFATRVAHRLEGKLVPILGYRTSMSENRCLASVLRDKAPGLGAQWLIGTNPEMVASSLVRGMLQQQYSISWIECMPTEVVAPLSDQEIERKLCIDLQGLSRRLWGQQEEEGFVSTAYSFARLGYTSYVAAMMKSPMYVEVKGSTSGMDSLFWDGLVSEKAFEETLTFVEDFLGIDRYDERVDASIAQNLHYLIRGVDSVEKIMRARLNALAERNRWLQAFRWLQYVLPWVENLPVVPEEVRDELRQSLKASRGDYRKIFLMMGVSDSGFTLQWLVESLGRDFVVDSYRATLQSKAKASEDECGLHGMRVDNRQVSFDHELLHAQGLLGAIRQILAEEHPNIWGKADRSASVRNPLESQALKVVEWVGRSFEYDLDKAALLWWLAALEGYWMHPRFVRALPMREEVLVMLDQPAKALLFAHQMDV